MINLTKTLSRGLVQVNQQGFANQGENISFLKMVESYFDKAGKHTHIRNDKLNFYKKPDNVVKFHLTLTRGTPPLPLDDGTIEMIPAFRCQHKTYKLPTKGGTRYADNVDI